MKVVVWDPSLQWCFGTQGLCLHLQHCLHYFPLTLATELWSLIRKVLSPTHFNVEKPYQLYPVCPICKSPNPAAGYHEAAILSKCQNKTFTKRNSRNMIPHAISDPAAVSALSLLPALSAEGTFGVERNQSSWLKLGRSSLPHSTPARHSGIHMSLTCLPLRPSFERHSITPAIIKTKVARAAPEFFSWQCNPAELLGLPIVLLWWSHTTRRTQSCPALWGCSRALWMWDHLAWDEKRWSHGDACSASASSTCCGHPKQEYHLCTLSFFPKQAFSFNSYKIFCLALSWPPALRIHPREACPPVTPWQNILFFFHMKKIWPRSKFGKWKAESQLFPL